MRFLTNSTQLRIENMRLIPLIGLNLLSLGFNASAENKNLVCAPVTNMEIAFASKRSGTAAITIIITTCDIKSLNPAL